MRARPGVDQCRIKDCSRQHGTVDSGLLPNKCLPAGPDIRVTGTVIYERGHAPISDSAMLTAKIVKAATGR